MSVNREKNYLIVLFEDSAYKDLFLGFSFSENPQVKQGKLYNGFKNIEIELTDEKSIIIKELNKYPKAYLLVLIDSDLDNHPESQIGKIEELRKSIDEKYKERIFIIGSKYEAEDIKQKIGQGKWKGIAKQLENSCKNENYTLWQNEMLKHNLGEIARLNKFFDWK